MGRGQVGFICLVQCGVDHSTGNKNINEYILQPNMTSPMSDRQVYVHMHLYYTLHGSADFRVWSWQLF